MTFARICIALVLILVPCGCPGQAASEPKRAEIDSAKLLFQNGKFAEAVEIYSQIAAQDPKDYEAILQLGRIALLSNRLDDAQQEQAIALHPDDVVTPFPFAGCAWQAGLKFTYKYANIESKENVSIPQEGSFTTVVGTPVTVDFAGFVPISPAEINLKHQLALMPTIGHSFGKVTIYTGGGPALFNIDTKFVNAVGFAVIGGNVVNVTGTPVTFSNDDWVWAARRRSARAGSWILATPMRGRRSSRSKTRRAFRTRTARSRAAASPS
jgi:Tetratricopeptide repeat